MVCEFGTADFVVVIIIVVGLLWIFPQSFRLFTMPAVLCLLLCYIFSCFDGHKI